MTDTRPPVKIRLRTLPAAAGLLWIRRGFRTFFRRPGGFMGLFGVVLLGLLLLVATPPAVQIVALVLMPLLSLGFMLATQDVLNDLPVRPSAFWKPMAAGADARRALLYIGMAYVVVFLLIFFFGDSIDGGEAKKWMETMFTPRADGTMPEPLPISGLATAVLMLKTFGLAIVSIPLWHAPALVYWGRHHAAQAMFSSVVSLWRTRAAFAAYLLGWFGIGLLFTLAIFVVGAVFGNLQVAVAVMTPVSWALSAVFYVTIWFGFVDTFEITVGTVAHRAVRADTP
jgi:hypothetical protein